MKRITVCIAIMAALVSCDNIPLMDYLETEVDYYQTRKALDEAVKEAQYLRDTSEEGIYPGQYAYNSISYLDNALYDIEWVFMEDYATIEDFHWALEHIEYALDLFHSKRKKAVDILFVTDVNGSMGAYITFIKTGIANVISNIGGYLGDVKYGAVSFRDFYVVGESYGLSGDLPFMLDCNLTSITSDLLTAVNNYFAASGADLPNSLLEALFQSSIQPGWRNDTDKVIIVFTIAVGHDSDIEYEYPGHGMMETIGILSQKNIRAVPLLITNAQPDAVAQNAAIAAATGGVFTDDIGSDLEIVTAVDLSLSTLFTYYY
ncbi:MAG: VWA domain-containing protein [Spirochaetales bacterium]|nr:VWA domain-containing protein [Spirochaetales bacterium]